MKKYMVLEVEQLSKKYEERTNVHLKPDAWQANGFEGVLTEHVPDDLAPNLHQRYLVTIEPIAKAPEGEHHSDYLKRLIEERKQADVAKTLGVTGRKFR